MPTFRNTLSVPSSTHIYLHMKMEQSVTKRRHINSRRWVITQKKAYNCVICLYRKVYMVCPKSNASDFFAQPRTARKGKWEYWQVEGEPTYTVGPSSVELAPLLQSVR